MLLKSQLKFIKKKQKMNNFIISKKWTIILISVFGLTVSSCGGGQKNCVKALMDDGYTYEDAVAECEDAALDSAIRGRE